ncbi:MAG: PAS domain-containing protein [Mucilaginibacter polytrichastri]|nr:PAS domain-containing protein [Mucilaginibacter polytrichastri]
MLNTERLLEILAFSDQATAIYTGENVIIEWANDAMIAFWGKDRGVIGQPMEQAVPELRGQPFIGMLRDVWLSGKTCSGTEAAAQLRVNGVLRTFYYDFEYRAMLDDNGSTICILHTADDVTERVMNRKIIEEAGRRESDLRMQVTEINKELEQTNNELRNANHFLALSNTELADINREMVDTQLVLNRSLIEQAKSEARIRFMLADAPMAISIFAGRDMVVETANKAVLAAWGKTGKVVGLPLREAVPELVGQPFLDILDQVFTTGKPYYGNEVRAELIQDGVRTEVYSNFVYQPFRDETGEVSHIMLIANIITDEVLARKQLERAEEDLRMATNAAELGTWYLETGNFHLVASPRFRSIIGLDEHTSPAYEDLIQLVHDDYRDIVSSQIDAAVHMQAALDTEFPVSAGEGTRNRWVRLVGKLDALNDTRYRRLSGIIHDVTERKLDELRKNDFIGMVSHELKTPLTSIKAYVQVLQNKMRGNDDPLLTSILEKADIQIRKMTAMINGFLNMSRLESGKIHLHVTRFDLSQLVSDVIDETRVVLSGHAIDFRCDDELPVNADREKIGSVISNLLSNAAKYSGNETTIEVRCHLTEHEAEVSVRDQGIGIRKHDLEKLFDRYYRVENKASDTISGFGIGLYLSAEIIRRHNGAIHVESEPGQGSRFAFSIPLNVKE